LAVISFLFLPPTHVGAVTAMVKAGVVALVDDYAQRACSRD
jgi:hypothetical protein